MAYIKGCCRTNIDDCKSEKWPTCFCALPRIGDRVKAKSGRVLRVVDVTHTLSPKESLSPDISADWTWEGNLEPSIIVELHKR